MTIWYSTAGTDEREGYVVRRLELKCGGRTSEVRHFQFLLWPNYGVPKGT